jgi:hypothetical protein
MLANFVPSSASPARRSIATWTHRAHFEQMERSFSGRAGGRKGQKPDGQPLQHDATKYARHASTEVDFEK